MRYQLRYIRAPRARSSPGAKHDDSRRERAHTNFLVRAVSRLSRRTWRADAAGIVGFWLVLVFDVVRRRRRSRGSVGERPLHTRKVAGSIPAGTTSSDLHGRGDSTLWIVGLVRFLSVRLVGGGLIKAVEVRGYVVEFIGVEVAVDVGGDGGCGVAHGFLDVAQISA